MKSSRDLIDEAMTKLFEQGKKRLEKKMLKEKSKHKSIKKLQSQEIDNLRIMHDQDSYRQEFATLLKQMQQKQKEVNSNLKKEEKQRQDMLKQDVLKAYKYRHVRRESENKKLKSKKSSTRPNL